MLPFGDHPPVTVRHHATRIIWLKGALPAEARSREFVAVPEEFQRKDGRIWSCGFARVRMTCVRSAGRPVPFNEDRTCWRPEMVRGGIVAPAERQGRAVRWRVAAPLYGRAASGKLLQYRPGKRSDGSPVPRVWVSLAASLD